MGKGAGKETWEYAAITAQRRKGYKARGCKIVRTACMPFHDRYIRIYGFKMKIREDTDSKPW